jgi:cytochrome b561
MDHPSPVTTTASSRFSSLSIGIHWLMLLLMIAVYATMELRGIFPKGSDPRELMKTWHFMLGLSVLALVLVRLAVNLMRVAPEIVPAPPRWQHLSAKAMHLALYALMIGLPLAGWLMLSAAGKPIPFFGLQLPALIAQNKETADFIKEVHEVVATAAYVLIGLHAAAALYHHYVVRDNTLQRMLPVKSS